MEIRATIQKIGKQGRLYLCVLAAMTFVTAAAQQRGKEKSYFIKNGKMYIELGRSLTAASVDSFINQFNLNGIGLKWLLQKNNSDSLVKLGWNIVINNKNQVVVSKPLISVDAIANPGDRIVFAEKHPTFAELFPVENNGVVYGYNRFKNKYPFAIKDLTVTFFLRNNVRAGKVLLAGSFTDWQQRPLRMVKTDSGWITSVKLKPGKYWYKFIVDGDWQLDNDNLLRENDGLGNTNSVFFVTNRLFTLNGYTNARKVSVAGSFNGWQADKLMMNKTTNGWQLPLYLAEATHTYRFVVNGNWMADPANPDKLPNEFNDYNSVIRIGRPYVFKLAGFINARQVILTGSFNNWRNNELQMIKTTNGWQLAYTLGSGNYEYAFIVDGKQTIDPSNPLVVKNHSYLVVSPNYTFRLKGHAGAKTVYLSGDFDNWSPNTLAMKREGNDWVFRVHLSTGKHLYKYFVDGSWINDPDNPLWEQNQYGTGNSVLWVE